MNEFSKTFIVAAGVVSLLSDAALAADLPTAEGPPVAPVYVQPPFTWAGFYAGVNAGGAWEEGNSNPLSTPFPGAVPVGAFVPLTSDSNGGGSFVGGIQGGYNYQFGVGSGFVLGGEADIDYANFRRSNNGLLFGSFTLPQFPFVVFSPSGLATAARSNNNQYFGTARLRAGYAFDRFLIYATGGLAYGGVNLSNGDDVGAALVATTTKVVNIMPGLGVVTTHTVVPIASTKGSSSKAGWTLGGGFEYAITNNWSVKAEYLYANFGQINDASSFVFNGVGALKNSSRAINDNVVRLGVNYKFW